MIKYLLFVIYIVDLLATDKLRANEDGSHRLFVENCIMRLPSDFECFLELFDSLVVLEDKEK